MEEKDEGDEEEEEEKKENDSRRRSRANVNRLTSNVGSEILHS